MKCKSQCSACLITYFHGLGFRDILPCLSLLIHSLCGVPISGGRNTLVVVKSSLFNFLSKSRLLPFNISMVRWVCGSGAGTGLNSGCSSCSTKKDLKMFLPIILLLLALDGN